MLAQYQIFRIDADGSRTLREDAPTYAYAEMTALKMAGSKPGRYAIVDQRSGQVTVMNLATPVDTRWDSPKKK
jgi:hypothetical protein